MADINALYEELTKFYFNKGPSAQLNGPAGAWRALEFSEFFVPGGGGLRFLLDFARSEECRDLINSDEVLARAIKQMDAAIVEISAVREIARKYLHQEGNNERARRVCRLCPEGAEARASVVGDTVSGCLCGCLSSQSLVDPANRIDLKDLA